MKDTNAIEKAIRDKCKKELDLIVSHYGVPANEFTYDYVSNKVDEVYSTFPNEEIHELITKIKQYKNG